MADAKNEYHLYIHADEVFGGTSNVVAGSAAAPSAGTGTTSDGAGKTAQGAAKAIKGLVSFSTAAAFADNIISYELSQVNLRTGAAEYEQRLQFRYSTAKKLYGIGAATVGGAIMGGPVGAVVGFLGSTVSTLISYAQRANILRTQENLENISIGMASQRAGVPGRRGEHQ